MAAFLLKLKLENLHQQTAFFVIGYEKIYLHICIVFDCKRHAHETHEKSQTHILPGYGHALGDVCDDE